MWIVLALIGGILVGVAASAVYFRARTIGLLRVDRSDPSEPRISFWKWKRIRTPCNMGGWWFCESGKRT